MVESPMPSWRNPAGTIFSAEPRMRRLLQRPGGPALRLQAVPGGAAGYAAQRPPFDLHVLILSHRVRATRYETILCGRRRSVVAAQDGHTLLPAGSDSAFIGEQADNEYAVLVMPPAWLDSLARRHDLPGAEPPAAIGQQAPGLAALTACLRTALAEGAATPGFLDHWSVLAGLEVLRLHRERPAGGGRAPALSPAMLRRVLALIDARLDEEIGLEELCGVAGLSPWHFARCFRAATGWPPHAYVTHQRLERAKRLLRDGRHGLSAVALDCGFASQSHFTVAFRRETGVTPGRWRQLAGVLPPRR